MSAYRKMLRRYEMLLIMKSELIALRLAVMTQYMALQMMTR